jgi:glutamyl-tRNA synthetase
LHLGHARTFLLAWLHTRSRGGRVVLRIEDLDAPRARPGATDAILRDLEWLGLDWDGAPVVQSSRLEELDAAVGRLVALGRAYACVCTRGDVQRAQSAPHLGDAEPRYPGTCRGRFRSVSEAEAMAGKPAGIRFQVPEGAVHFEDGLAGAQSSDVGAEVGDFPIARRGGAPAYQLAVVVDDAADGVTEVVRGDDLLPSTGRQVLLHEALALAPPAYWHVPLVLDSSGRRFAKRDRSVTLADLRDRGADPRSVVDWISRVSGGPSVDRVTPRELVPGFAIERVPRAPVVAGAETIDGLLG